MFRSKLWLILCLLLIAGCHSHSQGKEFVTNNTTDFLKALQVANTASAPLNPLALPIGAGLAGVIAMLESLRRVEKGKRKYAEHELNNNNKNRS